MQGYSTGIQNGFYCPNDIRQLEDLNLISEEDGGFKYMVNGNMVELKNVGAAYGVKKEETDVLSETDRTENREMDSPERRRPRQG